jgi:tetratricopeptide (TPR) repeat protein
VYAGARLNGKWVEVLFGASALMSLAACQKVPPAPKAIDSTALVQALTGANQPETAIANVRRAAAAGDGCRYAETAARAALDADLPALVRPLLEAAPKDCAQKTTYLGESAEALARAGEKDDARQAAKQALSSDSKNAYAELALARVAYDENQMKACSEHASHALALGRGAEADRLLGRALIALGKLQEAEAHYQSLLKTNPNDAEAAFSGAVCNDQLGHYSAAREGFLQTLRIEPKHVEARKYLVLLTYRAGAKAEARHHLEKLAEIVPKGSPLLSDLESAISTEPAATGSTKKL